MFFVCLFSLDKLESSEMVSKIVSEFDNYRSIKEFIIEPEYSDFLDDSGEFSWSAFFQANKTAQAASFNLFHDVQKNGMTKTEFRRSEFRTKNYLSCHFKYNPRYLWTQLHTLKMNDFSEFYKEIGIIRSKQDTSVEQMNKNKKAALVLMPQTIDRNFVFYPSIKNIR